MAESAPQAPLEPTLGQTRQWLGELFAPWVQQLRLEPLQASAGRVLVELPFDPALARVGGMVCGQALMAAADTAMVLAICALLGEFKPMTTINMSSAFLRVVAGSAARIDARVIKPGRNAMFAEAVVSTADGKEAARCSATYLLL
jgi:uncharacterized protein (TIGR00369 family)